MTDARYRIRIVPKTMGCVWKLVDPNGETVSYGVVPEDAFRSAPAKDQFSMTCDYIFGGVLRGLSRA